MRSGVVTRTTKLKLSTLFQLCDKDLLIVTVRSSDDSIVFSIVAKFTFLCVHDNLRFTNRLMKFCANMYLDNLKSPIEFQDHRSKSQDRISGFFTIAR